MDIAINVVPDVEIPIEELMKMFHPDNSQERDTEEMMAIRMSIRDHGFVGESIIVNKWNMKILGGHGRTEACWLEGYRGRLPVIYEEHKSEAAHRKRMLQLNLARGHQNLEMQSQQVLDLVEEFGQRQVAMELAFTPDEIAKMVETAERGPTNKAGGESSATEGSGGGSGGGSSEGMVTCPRCGHEFDA